MEDPFALSAVKLDDGTFVNSKIARVSELIGEFYPDLTVKWIPRDKRAPEDAAFCITERLQDGREVVAFYVQDEAEFDERVLARIFESDLKNSGQADDHLLKIDAINAAREAVRVHAENEAHEERMDLAKHVFKSKKHTYKHDGKRYGEDPRSWAEHRRIIIP